MLLRASILNEISNFSSSPIVARDKKAATMDHSRIIRSLQPIDLPMLRHPLPPPDRTTTLRYRQLINEVDAAIHLLIDSCFPGRLRCGPGCSSCCTRFSVLPLEAALMFAARPSWAPARAAGKDRCRLLSGDRCSIYPHRPIICRTQGLPIAYVHEDGTTLEVSACPLNFAEDHQFIHEELLFLDHYNDRLAELNRRYCRTNGIDPQLRIPIELLARNL